MARSRRQLTKEDAMPTLRRLLLAPLAGCGGGGNGNDIDAGTDTGADTDSDTDTGTGTESGTDTDTDSDTSTDSGSDTDTDTDSDTGIGMSDCDGGVLDPSSNLCWQNPPPDSWISWDDAVATCDALTAGGHEDWRLPMIQELISLLQGCVNGVETADSSASECAVTDPDCLASECSSSGCENCETYGGPDDDPPGCFWAPELGGECSGYWSSSPRTDEVDDFWVGNYQYGFVFFIDVASLAFVRCVREGP
jgi:hypothetical protein